MGFGVAFYSTVVGTLTALMTDEVYNSESLSLKLKAL